MIEFENARGPFKRHELREFELIELRRVAIDEAVEMTSLKVDREFNRSVGGHWHSDCVSRSNSNFCS
ncbi:MAG TPA: hypothetical protein DDX19_02145 [Rhodopirellula baltica]|jgi:hypothetical protein|uniref:Uncharacterized protein n=1 Tax=Rhodopirellula baltica (strain DSM 10527 / NCIMB 13988 / SH1) TaxID=243090 RepID=Q7USP2_RHOBA|nr:hypothetical protein RB4389 [Rhodopirellula baltica SH 1]HBE61582.1 hypothetical protein [Rhodopirellula baltica]